MEEYRARHESKHYIGRSDYLALRRRLLALMRPDPFAGEDGTYQVTSLYFDNFANRALMEKLSGLDNREKFRLRCYNGDLSLIRLEKKVKSHGQIRKRILPISRKECEGLIGGDIGWMMKSSDPLLLELYAKMRSSLLRPRTVVEYRREPYVYPPGDVRVTIDSGLKTLPSPEAFLDPGRTAIPVDLGGAFLLEVKYGPFLPEGVRGILQVPNLQASAFSKYAAGRAYG